jgi:hypothetical protein
MIGSDEPRAYARRTDPETSWEAARSVANIRDTQWIIWRTLIEAGPKTDGDLFPLILENHQKKFDKPISSSGARTRRHELQIIGLVEFTGDFGKTDGGRPTRIWRALTLKEFRERQNEKARQAELPL